MAERQFVVLDPAVASILTPGARPEPEPSKRKTKCRPHEQERKRRVMSVTFPSPEWKDTVRGLARSWGARESDVMTFAVAYLMRAIEDDGDVGQPVLGQAGFQDRTGETLDLPWEPRE